MTLYRIVVNIAHVFRAFNFRTSHAVRKYFNIEVFAIYGINLQCVVLQYPPTCVFWIVTILK